MEVNRKGTKCPFKAIFCQEGLCSECEVSKEYQRGREVDYTNTRGLYP